MSEETVDWAILEFDLRDFIEVAKQALDVDAIYIFGSRRFKTGSLRSDIDIILSSSQFLRSADLRDLIDHQCAALDLFQLYQGRAVSATNESLIDFADNETLLSEIRAVKLWSKTEGLLESGAPHWIQNYADNIAFHKTILPNFRMPLTLERVKANLESQGLPIEPLIGTNEDEIAAHLIQVAESITKFKERDFPGKGSARRAFVLKPSSECDFQDLFWLAVKPWLPAMVRENPEIVFDNQRKISDFSFANSRFIIEMKFAKDEGDKREIAKTLDGLANFYKQAANVRFILFVVYATPDAKIDSRLWEQQYSRRYGGCRTVLKVIEVNGSTPELAENVPDIPDK
ncbi:hypothetical protein HFO07_24645 [Rhizobium leguminosarum]|uniref:PD-(D/E)XK nuclease domain-containing protein n=1 Tax=Rhizobium leguminosarum TaxID=384 RepID=UPI001C987AC3|nr:hypothetical protein [Rhizobium leguminosarum]MBY5759801.1 hypothetical protein [Rhizobium leguminosarum]